VYGICTLVAILSLVTNFVENDNRLSAAIVILFCAVAWVGIQYLGYAEFSVAGRMLFRGDFQRTLKAQLDLNAFEKQLAETKSVEECWQRLVESAPKFGFTCLRMEIPGQVFEAAPAAGPLEPHSSPRWACRLPILGTGCIELGRNSEGAVLSTVVGPFIDVIHARLEIRIRELRMQAPPVAVPVSNLASSESAS
jgi:hypothetical protein